MTFHRSFLRRGVLAALLGGGLLAMAHALAQSEAQAAAAPRGIIGAGLLIVLALILGVTAFGNRRGPRRRRRRGGSAAADGAGDGGSVMGGKACPEGSAGHSDGGHCADGGAGAGSGCGSSGGGGGGCGGGS